MSDVASEVIGRLGDALRQMRRACATPLRGLAFAVALVGTATLLRQAIGDPVPRLVVFHFAVAVAALLGGFRCGLMATALAAVAADLLLFAPRGSLWLENLGDMVYLGSFVATGLVVSLIAAADQTTLDRDHRRSRQSLVSSEARYRSVVTALHEGVLVFSTEAKIVSCNPSAERILAHSEAELTALDSPLVQRTLYGADGRPLSRDQIPVERVLATGLPCHDVVIGVMAGDGMVWLSENAEPIRDPLTGEIQAVVVTLADITERRRVESELDQSRARFASIVAGALDAIVTVDAEQKIVLFNRAAERMFGCSEAEALGMSLSTFVPERHRVAHDAGFRRFAQGPGASRMMGRGIAIAARRLDGSEFPIEASISRIDSAGGPLFTIIHRDISERLEAERTNARLATVVMASPAAIIGGTPDGIIDSWNTAATAMFGHTAEEAIGSKAGFLSFPDDPEHGAKIYARVVAEGVAMEGEGVRRRRDGTAIDVAYQAAPIRDAEGRVTAVSLMMTDITRRKRAERLLQERDQELRQTLDAAGLGVWWIDVASGLVHCDTRSRALFAVEETAPVATIAALFRWEERPAFLRPGWQGDGTRGDAPLVVRANYGDGRLAWLSLTANPRTTDRRTAEIWGTVSDVTDQRTTEQAMKQMEASRRLEALGRMTGGIAHDFNNLLTVISGNLQLLELLPQEPAGLRYIAEALRATESGANLNHRLTTFARQRRLEPTVTDLNERVAAMIDLVHRSVGPQISVTANFASDLWHVRIDPTEIESAVLNLVFNARDAMPAGGRIVIDTCNMDLDAATLPADPNQLPGAYVRLSVSDTGVGMAPEVKARAFEPFFTTKAIGRGTGLGLATLHGFVRQSGGFVTLYSEVDRGTTINIYLPRAECGEIPVRPIEASLPRRGMGQTVLVVEDHPEVARVTRERLLALGYQVIEADHAAAALEMLAERPEIDLVFSDIMMPGGLSGLDLARRLRAEMPDRRILLTSGFAEAIARGDGPAPLEFALLRKPYSQADLARAIAEALDGSDLQRRPTSAENT
ncbi:PAS domain S-box protein [Siculibacillus lacustris]|uniref:histidine kinase n=1 Tax=Siculibacillus lacustris TaxID=1549641 RepID=A0A4Q9VGB8_9HYPH|nr:PAS domain S-box protein [Siculibacillus lacustris]TBW33870.1 PAS domain S-box protein [Siculibacillus lacustris]